MYPHFVFLGHTFFVFTFEKKTAERTPKHEKRGGGDEVRLCLLCMWMVNHGMTSLE